MPHFFALRLLPLRVLISFLFSETGKSDVCYFKKRHPIWQESDTRFRSSAVLVIRSMSQRIAANQHIASPTSQLSRAYWKNAV